MNTIREIERLNQQELDNGIPIEASWHNDYKDTAYIFIGGLPFELTEGDILTIFSQFGNPVHVNLMRDKDTGKSRGFAFLKYEDQRSTILAVDNMCGVDILGRKLRVDHTYYKNKEGQDELERQMEFNLPPHERTRRQQERETTAEQQELESRDSTPRQENQIAEAATVSVGRPGQQTPPPVDETKLLQDLDEDDPMRQYLIEKRRAELLAQSRERERREKHQSGDSSHRHHHRRHHRSDDKDDERRHHRSQKSSSHRRHHKSREDDEK